MAQTRYCSYAGIALSLSTPELEEGVDQLLPIPAFVDWEAWQFAGYDLQKLPTPPLPVAPPVEIGVLHWPADATRPAWFHAVVNDDQLTAIRAAITDPLTPANLVLADGRTGKTVTASMYLLPPRPISQLGLGTDGWLITLTDQRFYWPWKDGSVETKPDTWADLFTRLGEILGVTITVDTIDPEYGAPSAKWVGWLRPAATVFDAAAAQVGQRVVVGLDGTVRTVNWETARTEATDQWVDLTVSMGGLIPEEYIGLYVPASVTVAFANTSSGTLAVAPKVYTKTLASLAITEYGSQTGVAGMVGTVFADYAYTGANNTECNALAAVMAEDWYGWRLPDLDLASPGIEPWAPTGWEDAVEWVAQLKDGEPHEPLALTRLRREPWSNFPSGRWSGEDAEVEIGSDCSVLLGNLRTGSCFTLAIAAGLGSCSCIEAQTTAMIWDDDANAAIGQDLIYGCPPGVVTTLCPDGGPLKYKIVASGFTGACSVLNGTWTFTWSSGETWTASLGGVPATLVLSAGPVMTVTFTVGTDEVRYNGAVTNCCSDTVLDRDVADACDASPATLTAEVVTACGLGTPYYAYLDECEDSCGRPSPRLRLVPAAGSGAATITFGNSGCTSDGKGLFSTSNPIFCTGTPDGACGTNTVTAVVSCGCGEIPPVIFDTCPIPGGSANVCLVVTDMLGTNPELESQYDLDNTGSYQFKYIGDGFCAYNYSVACEWHNYPYTITLECRPAPEDPSKFSVYLTIAYTAPPTTAQTWSFEEVRLTEVTSGVFQANIRGAFTGSAGGGGACPVPTSTALIRGTVTFTTCTSTPPDCTTIATPTTFNCLESGSCVDPGDGSGTFTGPTAEADCLAVCAGGGSTCCLPYLSGKAAELVITGGGCASSTAANWTTTSSCVDLQFSSGDIYVYWDAVAETFKLHVSSGACGGGLPAVSYNSPATSVSCGPPSVITFNDPTLLADMGATDITITT